MAEPDIALPTPAFAPVDRARRAPAWPRAVWAVACAAAVVGFVATSPTEASRAADSAGHDLVLLLRFMAILKAGFALAAVGLAAWRLGFPASPRVALGYLAACALMPAGAALIWHLTHVIAGAALFHAGLLWMLAIAWTDQDETGALLMRTVRRRIPPHDPNPR